MPCSRAFVLAAVLLAAAPPQVVGSVRSVGAAVSDAEANANPIRRVVSLLQAMQKKVAAEGEKEEELHDKFMCYCQTGAADLKKSIGESTAKVPQLQSSIEEAEAQKVQLEADVKQHQTDRAEAEAAMKEATAIREKEAKAFAEAKAEYDANIDALGKAIAAIDKGMAGGFLQTPAASVLRRLTVSVADLSDWDRDLVSSFLSQRVSSGQGYIPQSGEISGILKQLQETMEKDLASITAEEEEAKKTYEGLIAAKTKEVAAATKAIEEKLGRIGTLGVEIVTMKSDLTDSEAALIEDQKFLADLDKNCATQKDEYAERVKTRAEELVAIAETIKILNDDDALELFKKTLPSPSLMQVKARAADIRGRALTVVRKALGSLKGGARVPLGLVSVALGGKKVSFDKVIKMIDDMVVLLQKEQQEDDDKWEYCNTIMDQTEDKVKELKHDINDLDTAIEDMTGALATTVEDIKTLEEGIKTLDKAVLEATEQRKAEHEDFTELMASDNAAKELLGFAKNRLNKFYNPKLYKPPPKRELSEEEKISENMSEGLGGAVLAQVRAVRGRDAPPPPPEALPAYQKKSEESGGVIAMIDMLIADLDKEMTEANTEEENAQVEYERVMSDSAAKRADDSKALTNKESAKAQLEMDLQKSKEEQVTKTKEMMATEKFLNGLHGECDWLIQNFDLRKEARASEVDALKQAKAVLSGADFSLVQRVAQTAKALRLRGGQ